MRHAGLPNKKPEVTRRHLFASGGLGSTFLVYKPLLGGLCVEKRLHAHLAELRPFRQRFVLEARIGLALRHPNLSQALLLVDAPGSHLRFYQQVVSGPTLAALRPFLSQASEQVRLALAGQILADGFAALEHLYSVHITGRPGGRVLAHSDIAPGNLVIGEDLRVVLIDYGQARTSEDPDRETDTLGHMSRFLAPWCLNGKEVTCPASDTWSLVLVALDVATGCSVRTQSATRFDVTGLADHVFRATRALETREEECVWLQSALGVLQCDSAKDVVAHSSSLRAACALMPCAAVDNSSAGISGQAPVALASLRLVATEAFEAFRQKATEAVFGHDSLGDEVALG